MTKKDNNKKKTLTLSKDKLSEISKNPKPNPNSGQKTVEVEIKRKRVSFEEEKVVKPIPKEEKTQTETPQKKPNPKDSHQGLTDDQWKKRIEALEQARQSKEEKEGSDHTELYQYSQKEQPPKTQDHKPKETEEATPNKTTPSHNKKTFKTSKTTSTNYDNESPTSKSSLSPSKKTMVSRRPKKLTITQALDFSEGREGKMRSLSALKRAQKKQKLSDSQQKQHIVREINIPQNISVTELANRMAVRLNDVISKMKQIGVEYNKDKTLDADTAELLVQEFNHKVNRVDDSYQDKEMLKISVNEDKLQHRPPVVAIMGHVDHGKTSILDIFRHSNIVSKEHGNITQHIGAYQIINKKGKKITFLDTPGHAAFTEMRARGANFTDIVLIVVAADDGIKEQTIEAIKHTLAAKVPIIIVINKIDKPDAEPDKIHTQLLQHEIITEKMGGDVLTINISAKEKKNIDTLEDAIFLQAEMLELKADPTTAARGVVLESKMVKGQGNVATVLIQSGTLKQGQFFVSSSFVGKVRSMFNDLGKSIKEALPSQPIEISGFSHSPCAGDDFSVVEKESQAKEIAAIRTLREQTKKEALQIKPTFASFDELIKQQQESDEKKQLYILVKADTQGSIEAIISLLDKLPKKSVNIKILLSGVGGITENDIHLAQASDALIIGFHVRATDKIKSIANRVQVPIQFFYVIYEIEEYLKNFMEGLLDTIKEEVSLGHANILDIFKLSSGRVAGCKVTKGLIKRKAKIRVMREDVVIHEGDVKSLKHFKDEVQEVKEGNEFGIIFSAFNEFSKNDTIECYEINEIKRELE